MYYKYLKYVIVHKWYVLVECFKVGEYWRGITHDLSKFLPSEFIPYARYFYGDFPEWSKVPAGLKWQFPDMLTKEQVEKDFDEAWLKHIHRNKHHWQYWILREDDGVTKILKMPFNYLVEMVCDWNGAGMAINGNKNTKEWYSKNKEKILLEKNTREKVDYLVDKIG